MKQCKGCKRQCCLSRQNNKHMYELSNRIRLINVGDFPIDTYDAFIGFICGLISQDRDLEHMFFDSFLTIASVSDDYVGYVLSKLADVSEKFNVDLRSVFPLMRIIFQKSLRRISLSPYNLDIIS